MKRREIENEGAVGKRETTRKKIYWKGKRKRKGENRTNTAGGKFISSKELEELSNEG